MKANELRLGNIILQRGSPIQISTNYSLFKIMVCIDRNDGRHKPIPLTEEWLLKFGFDKINANWYEITIRDFVKLRISTLSNVVNLKDERNKEPKDTIVFFDCKYAHQIQNLYFALTGEELQIK